MKLDSNGIFSVEYAQMIETVSLKEEEKEDETKTNTKTNSTEGDEKKEGEGKKEGEDKDSKDKKEEVRLLATVCLPHPACFHFHHF